MVTLTLTVTRDTEGCFFLIFICCAGFQFGTQDILSTVAGRV